MTAAPLDFPSFANCLAVGLRLPTEGFVPDARLVEDLGLDSFDLVEVLTMVEELGAHLPDEAAAALSTVNDLYDEYRRRSPPGRRGVGLGRIGDRHRRRHRAPAVSAQPASATPADATSDARITTMGRTTGMTELTEPTVDATTPGRTTGAIGTAGTVSAGTVSAGAVSAGAAGGGSEERRTWYHTIDLPDGTCTPGWYDTRPLADVVPWPAAMRGGRCLDVGTFDGFWAFEMERRGANEVVAVDLDDPSRLDWAYDQRARGLRAIDDWGSGRGPGFAEVRARLGSAVVRRNRSVYDLDPEEDGRFDVVLCGALLLHLRDPVLALERMRAVCRGALVLVESLDPRLELIAPTMPVAYLHPVHDEWWVTNSRGLMHMTEVAGFRVVDSGKRFLVGYGPGGPSHRTLPWLGGLAARRPGRRGLLQRILVAEPRPPADPHPPPGS